jgi:2-polyprenyl-6-methoxyphenol hydroxylase-like FAD-dependent oxidoreductase
MRGTKVNEVIIVGAGPGGLFLACELALAGIQCKVLERREGPSRESRATGLQARTLELLAMRGIVDRFLSRGYALDHWRLSLGAACIDLHRLETNYQQLNICPQSTTEELLEQRARELGAVIERGAEVTGLDQDADGVALRICSDAAERVERGQWVAGFDGAHSSVRQFAGIDFPGKTYDYNVFIADVRIARKPTDGVLIQVSRHGLVVAIDYGNGWWRMGCVDRSQPRPPREPVTLDEIRTRLIKVFGYDLGPSEPIWTSRFRFNKRMASAYRVNRIILGGDAAHVHAPLGAQGLNISMQDAMNLGWKLAAVIRGRAPETLLDTYEQERRPIGRRVLAATDRAMHVMMSEHLPVRLMRRLVVPTVARFPRSHDLLAGQLSNIAMRYPADIRAGHAAIVGDRVPDLMVEDGDGAPQRLYDLFHSGRFVLLDQRDGALSTACAPWADRIVRVRGRLAGAPGLGAYHGLLCRPDGYFGWAGRADGQAMLLELLRERCGEPAQVPRSPSPEHQPS